MSRGLCGDQALPGTCPTPRLWGLALGLGQALMSTALTAVLISLRGWVSTLVTEELQLGLRPWDSSFRVPTREFPKGPSAQLLSSVLLPETCSLWL